MFRIGYWVTPCFDHSGEGSLGGGKRMDESHLVFSQDRVSNELVWMDVILQLGLRQGKQILIDCASEWSGSSSDQVTYKYVQMNILVDRYQ